MGHRMSREAATAAHGRLAAGRTVVGSAPEMLWNVAWIDTVPSAIAVTRPPGVTVATFGSDDVHVAVLVTTSVVPLLIVAVAVNCDDDPTVGGAPVTETDETTDGDVAEPHADAITLRLMMTRERPIDFAHTYE